MGLWSAAEADQWNNLFNIRYHFNITVLSATGHCGNCICLQNQFSTEKWRLCRSAECSKESEDVTIIGTVAALVVSIFYIIFAIVIGIGSSDFDDDPVSNVVENVIEDKNDSKKADDSDKSDKAAKSTEPAVASGELGTSWDSYTVQINDKS